MTGGAGAVVRVYDEDYEVLTDAPVEDITYGHLFEGLGEAACGC